MRKIPHRAGTNAGFRDDVSLGKAFNRQRTQRKAAKCAKEGELAEDAWSFKGLSAAITVEGGGIGL